MNEISNIYNCSSTTIRNLLINNNIKIRSVGTLPQKNIIKIPHKRELIKFYVIRKLTLREVGEIYNVSRSTIKRWLNIYNIYIRTQAESLSIESPSRDELIELYINKKFTLDKIKKIYNVSESTVEKWLHGYNIHIQDRIKIPSEEEIIELYINKGVSRRKMTKIYNVSSGIIVKWLYKYKIPIRGYSESKKGDKNNCWKGGKTKKHLIIRNSIKYKDLRTFVFKRDNYTCQITGQIGGELEMHHIEPFRDNRYWQLEPLNCITLSKKFHQLIKNKEYLYSDLFRLILYKQIINTDN